MSLDYSFAFIRSKVPHYERHDTEISTHFSPRGQPHVGIIPGAHTSLSGEAGPGKAVLVATGFLWAGADRGRLLMLRSVCMRRDIVVGFVGGCPSRRWLPRYSLPSQANRWR